MTSDNKLGLQVVVDSPGESPIEGETVDLTVADEAGDLTEESQVDHVFAVLEQQNTELINRLGILGRGINPLVLLKIQLDVLIDFVFEDGEPRKNYETACSMRLNETLKTTLAKLIGASTDG